MSFDPYIMIQNFEIIGSILMTVSILLGLGLMVGAFFQFKRYGEVRGNFMAYQIPITGPTVMLLCGAALLALPTVAGVLMYGLWGDSSPLSYGAAIGPLDQIMSAIVVFVRLLGVGSLIRGIVILSRVGAQGQQPGMVGKSLIHLLGGILLINIVATWNLLHYIFFGT